MVMPVSFAAPPETHTEADADADAYRLCPFCGGCSAFSLLLAVWKMISSALNLLDTECRELRCLTYLPAVQTLAAVLSAARGIDTSRRRYSGFFCPDGSKME